MSPLLPLDTWTTRTFRPEKPPKAKCFLIGEGANTEYWYLSSLAKRLAKKNIPELIELKPIERTEGDRNQSAPVRLLEQARRIRKDKYGDFGFDTASDRVVAFFDTDIYSDDPEEYSALLREYEGIAQVAVTNPSFELFLLLHVDDAYEQIIQPNAERILRNGRVGKRRRFVDKLASDVLGLNVKTNPGVEKLAERFEIAAQAEGMLNQDPSTAIGNLTSNVAATIVEMIREGSGAEKT